MRLLFVRTFGDGSSKFTKSYFVTDNGSNIPTAFNNSISCSCHNLSLVLNHSLSESIPEAFLPKKEEFFRRAPSQTIKQYKQMVSARMKEIQEPLR